ncbi:hypothetical protein GUJ93_ZPchr0008g12482 [Zizania palustris]|uniref:Uncharacterized protein n=1 Tax=Zizania palustris TaxID=103762 RepID=A0A8J5RUU2_ZIZPA|nr:hypothetical protein GUJ93_ZPchr0008g12482 [Zizania palustris]
MTSKGMRVDQNIKTVTCCRAAMPASLNRENAVISSPWPDWLQFLICNNHIIFLIRFPVFVCDGDRDGI